MHLLCVRAWCRCKLSNDFKGMPLAEAMSDLGSRVSHYEKIYQTVREAEGAYIKIFDMRAKVHVANVYGRMAKSVLPYLMACHNIDRPVFLLSVDEKEGGSAPLPPRHPQEREASAHRAAQ